jgi:hypothetical protein
VRVQRVISDRYRILVSSFQQPSLMRISTKAVMGAVNVVRRIMR